MRLLISALTRNLAKISHVEAQTADHEFVLPLIERLDGSVELSAAARKLAASATSVLGTASTGERPGVKREAWRVSSEFWQKRYGTVFDSKKMPHCQPLAGDL